MEYKRIQLSEVQVKFGDDTNRTFEGYASVFGGVDSYGDQIVKGAYEKTLQGRDRPVRMRWNHFGPVIGKWMDISEDQNGLYVRGSLTPGHSIADDVYASMKHGAVDGMSIGYRVKRDSTEGAIRKLEEIELIEISVVEEPADLGAMVSQVKNMGDAIHKCESYKELESLLRESAGFSRSNATIFVNRVKSLSLGDRERNRDQVSFADRIMSMKL
jgi:HK97 family phage prohead protease